MKSVFSRIISGELPAHIVFRDEHCIAFLSIAPHSQGHTLLVPLLEMDHWLDLPPLLLSHLTKVSATLGRAIFQAFPCKRVAMMIAGFEVPHVHIHLIPSDSAKDLDFENRDQVVLLKDLEKVASTLRHQLTLLSTQQASIP